MNEIYADDVDWKATAANLQREVTRMRRVIGEYVGEVESGEKFDALVRLVPGLASDDGEYGDVA